MSDKYLDQARQVTMVWRKILSTKEFESITVAKWWALDAEITAALRQAAADATRAERERCAKIAEHWRLDADLLFPVLPMPTHLRAIATLKEIAAAIRAEPDAGDAEKGEG